MNLHLGCGQNIMAGWVNCDLYDGPGVDKVFDLAEKWPLEDDTAVQVYASHVLEHLHDPKAFFRELWRVLHPQGTVLLRVPFGGHRAAWWDIEHVRPWYAEAFAFLQPGYAASIGNPQHDAWQWPFEVQMTRQRVGAHLVPLLKWKWVRRLLLRVPEFLDAGIEELYVDLAPIKTEAQREDFLSRRQPNMIWTAYVVYSHHLEGRDVAIGQPTSLITIGEGEILNGFDPTGGQTR